MTAQQNKNGFTKKISNIPKGKVTNSLPTLYCKYYQDFVEGERHYCTHKFLYSALLNMYEVCINKFPETHALYNIDNWTRHGHCMPTVRLIYFLELGILGT